MKKLLALLAVAALSVIPVFVSAGPASAATCSGGWFNAQYPTGSGHATGSCGSGAVGYPYASHTSPVTNMCVQWFNSFDQWQSMGCTAIMNNSGPVFATGTYHAGSWRTVVTGGSGNVYSATRTL